MKQHYIAGTIIACLTLLSIKDVSCQSQSSTKSTGNSLGELVVSNEARDYPGYLSVEPNPVCKQSVVHCTPNLKSGRIIIYDLSGKVMAKFEDVQSGMVSLEKKNLPAGVYLLQLRDNDITIQTRRIVVE